MVVGHTKVKQLSNITIMVVSNFLLVYCRHFVFSDSKYFEKKRYSKPYVRKIVFIKNLLMFVPE